MADAGAVKVQAYKPDSLTLKADTKYFLRNTGSVFSQKEECVSRLIFFENESE
jgi:hypothetical protein